MSASRARRIAVAAITSLTLVLSFAPAASAAGPQLPLPDTMAAVGDSITQAASTGGSLGADAPQNSWSTGTSTTVNSHYLRLLTAGALISGRNYNFSVSGAKVANLDGQMVNASTVQPDYLTVLIGGNDLCTDTVGAMTDPGVFHTEFEQAMNALYTRSPNTNVYVVSIPDVYQLWNLFKGNFWARFIWSTADICQSLLANPTSTHPADEQRRQDVRNRNIAFNAALADVCRQFPRCHFDGNAAFAYQFARSDVSGDYFHPSVSGQANLASVSWTAGYAFGGTPNQPPTARFSADCTNLECRFTDSSSDDGGIVSRSWTFGDGASSTASNPVHTYGGAGTYTVTLTVRDGGGLTSSVSQQVAVTAGTQNQPPTANFTFSCTHLECDFTDTSSDDGDIVSRSWDFGDGTGDTGSNPSHTFPAPGDYTVTLTVSDGALSDSEARTVTVAAAPVANMSLASFTASGVSTGKNTWQARATFSVTGPDGQGVNGATVSVSWGSGAGSCTTSAGSCTVTTENLNVRKVGSVTFTLTGISHSLYAYDLPDPAPSRTAARP